MIHSHNHLLVIASFLVAMMAGFTGLSLLKGASELSLPIRKARIALASVAMGGGVWSMHFVAMLGLQLQTPFFYDPLTTMASALIAILVVGLALLILHFRSRTTETIVASGILVGIGILVMHYLGMSGIRLVTPEYSAIGITFAVIVSVCLSVNDNHDRLSRTHQPQHHIGNDRVWYRGFLPSTSRRWPAPVFLPVQDSSAGALLISNEALAIGVATAAFIICGGFLLTGATFLPHIPENQEQHPQADEVKNDVLRIPYEKNNRTFFVEPSTIAAIRAEGHYCLLYVEKEKLFCPWSISQVVKRLSKENFIRAHRSYLINPTHVSGFERKKDNGICYFDTFASLEKVPVSRSRLTEVRGALGLS